MFIAIEGPDVCGKGTQTELLAQQLDAKRFKFPDKNTPIGALIYDHRFQRLAAVGAIEANAADDPSEQSQLMAQGLADPMMFQCMQMANRLEHAEEIADTLHNGQDVVADRYIASGIVYGGSDGLDSGYIHKIQNWLPQPDLNILLDIGLAVAVERMRERGDTNDRYENEDVLRDTIDRYRALWVEMAEKDGSERWVVVDGNRSKVEVQADVIVAVKAIIARNT
jgi:dTMP kinase